jgi:hypothetical protein
MLGLVRSKKVSDNKHSLFRYKRRVEFLILQDRKITVLPVRKVFEKKAVLVRLNTITESK